MSSKTKVAIYAVISVLANLIALNIFTGDTRGYVILALNLLQVVYAYFDPTYTVQKYGLAKK